MFDWNGNGEHDPFDDFVTFGLLEDMINEGRMKSPLQEIVTGEIIIAMISIRTLTVPARMQ